MATVAAGVTLSSYGRTKISPPVAEFMHGFWKYLAYIANALIFFLVGIVIPLRIPPQEWGDYLPPLGVTIVAVIFARAVGVFSLVPLVGRFTEKIDRRFQTIMFWGGLRGAVALALVLAVVNNPQISEAVRSLFLTLGAGVILVTLLVNALTIRPLLEFFDLHKYDRAELLVRGQGMLSVLSRVKGELTRLREEKVFAPPVLERLGKEYEKREQQLQEELKEVKSDAHRRAPLLRRPLRPRHPPGEDHQGSAALGGPPARSLEDGRRVARRPLPPHLDAGGPDPAVDRAGSHPDPGRLALQPQGRPAGRHLRHHPRHPARVPRRAGRAPSLARHRRCRPPGPGRSRTALRKLDVPRPGAHEPHGRPVSGVIPDKVVDEMTGTIEEEMARIRRFPRSALRFDVRDLLRQVPFFKEAPSLCIEELAKRARPHTALEEESLFQEGDSGDSLYLIARGAVRISVSRPNRILAVLGSGDFFGEMALLSARPRTASATAATPANLVELRRRDVEEVEELVPELHTAMQEAYRQRLVDQALARHPAFADEQRKTLVHFFRAVDLKEGDDLINEGPCLLVVRSGALRVSTRKLGEGDVYGAEVFLGAESASGTARALRPSSVFVLGRDDLERLREAAPGLPPLVTHRLTRPKP
jgi:CPA1 family monovalent cation:H+ antiporter